MGIMMLLLCMMVLLGELSAEPIILKGNAIPELIGTPLRNLRMCTIDGLSIPFQIDEVTAEGEYVCDAGDASNSDSGNSVLDTSDEIVFMGEDAQEMVNEYRGSASAVSSLLQPIVKKGALWYPIVIESSSNRRCVFITADTSILKSGVWYITYDHTTQMLRTPRYYAQFARNRFHFVRAGVSDSTGRKWIHLTRELRVEILLKALWGLLPIRYTEDNLICYVKRYKVGPVRCIRRGDFHLQLGLGMKGSRASVNQCCYPQMVCVPVYVHVPVRFKRFFNQAWMEMTPVIDTAGSGYFFNVPDCGIREPIGATGKNDTVIDCMPTGVLFTVQHDFNGYGWILTTNIPDSSIVGSGFVVRRSLLRHGIAACGFRLELRDIMRGRYRITNRVLFTQNYRQDIVAACAGVINSSRLLTTGGTFFNHLNDQ